jgi:hypothetical protein
MNLKFYPFEKYTLTTKLSGEEVLMRIAQNIIPKQKFSTIHFGGTPSKPYKGTIAGNSFSLSRIIDYRNSFQPVITGSVSTFPDRTEVKIKMRPVRFVIVFMGFWLGIAGLVCCSLILYALFHINQLVQKGFSPNIIIPFALFTAGYLMITVGFKHESKKSKSFLATLLEEQKNY